ncbi:PAS domain-containing protein [Paenibacillus antri]|uniref:histidine kinase n=1 Tax=Paenibacillus antri TaxID=2582848 RepID=A0A5R9G5P5_9BACL|nr:ATP-binding protein [Paenibacillus antri]TLS49646.1 PAS domain-containing protein [Paenibacillus antri]
MLEPHWWTVHTTNRKDELTNIFDGLFLVLDGDGRICYAQSDVASALGLRPEELVGRPFAELTVDASSFEEVLEGAIGSSRPTLALRAPGVAALTTEYSVFRVEGAERVRYVLSLHRLNGDARLNMLQRFAGAFMKDVNLGVLLINPEFELVEISDTACRILGVSREAAIGRSMDDVFEGVPVQHRLVQRTLLDGMVVKNHAVSWTNDRERFELIMDTSLLKDAEGRVAGAYVIFKDVSNLRSLEQQVQRSDRLAMIGQIAAGTAHEIRNPLTSIKGFLQVLKKSLGERGMTKEFGYAELMLSEIDRINDLVSEFLLLSKPKDTTFSVIDAAAVIREILPIINNEAILHGVTVEYRAELDPPPIVADRELLKQVFINLSKNGIEAMAAEGGTLTITEKTDRIQQRLNVYVQDTGPGIPPFLIDKIFDPFFTTKEEGTGLGLAVCQRIVHDMGGTLRVSSKGYGTIFVVSIPYAKP